MAMRSNRGNGWSAIDWVKLAGTVTLAGIGIGVLRSGGMKAYKGGKAFSEAFEQATSKAKDIQQDLLFQTRAGVYRRLQAAHGRNFTKYDALKAVGVIQRAARGGDKTAGATLKRFDEYAEDLGIGWSRKERVSKMMKVYENSPGLGKFGRFTAKTARKAAEAIEAGIEDVTGRGWYKKAAGEASKGYHHAYGWASGQYGMLGEYWSGKGMWQNRMEAWATAHGNTGWPFENPAGMAKWANRATLVGGAYVAADFLNPWGFGRVLSD